MNLNKAKGNMYEFITHTWNPIKGKCFHDCSYCYMKMMNPNARSIRLAEEELQGSFLPNLFIFIGSSTDMFAQDVPDEWITKILDFCYERTRHQHPQERTRFLIQTKNPQRLLDFINHPLFDAERKQAVVCTTLETNRYYQDFMGNAPLPQQRVEAMKEISKVGIETYVTIEPIMDFDLTELVSFIKQCNPVQVNIGKNTNGKVNLPHPTIGKTVDLILQINGFTKVHIKKNANENNRLYKAMIQKMKEDIFPQ